MPSSSQTAAVSNASLWAGRIITAVMVLFMLFDAIMKILRTTAAVEGTVRLGYPASMVAPIGFVALLCAIFYAIPRTSILGAVLLTGYLGGAVASQVRIQSPLFFFPILMGGLIWLGPFLTDWRLRTLIPVRRIKSAV